MDPGGRRVPNPLTACFIENKHKKKTKKREEEEKEENERKDGGGGRRRHDLEGKKILALLNDLDRRFTTKYMKAGTHLKVLPYSPTSMVRKQNHIRDHSHHTCLSVSQNTAHKRRSRGALLTCYTPSRHPASCRPGPLRHAFSAAPFCP